MSDSKPRWTRWWRSCSRRTSTAVRQLKFIINRGVEADLYTAQGFEALSAGLTGAVNGAWQVPDADAGQAPTKRARSQ